MSRTSQTAEAVVEETVTEPVVKEVIETKPTTTAKATDKVVAKEPVESLSLKVAIDPTKKIGITRYLQLHPTGNKTLDRTLTKLFGSEVHTEAEWEKIINDFLNS